ncbi:MAG TPA: murein biosynthesis integral membrane protein MurJ [Rhodospirillaceae bacterium]|nr:MAG: murein biosynthesis integral membrane protein MurJ [Alphaproteobacteria bacterium GWF2_58_20]HAU29280.1 murein biosynthesis integral membrane protein MurJ [Rhodospirillaceae bacterium]
MSFIKSTATVAGLTMVSRITGLIRDQLTAAALGAGGVADAFFVALKLPNLFRLVFAEGAFSASFVPLFSRDMENNGKESAVAFAEESLAAMLFILLPFTILMIAAMPWVMFLFAPGFSDDPQRVAWAVSMCRITFPYLMLVSLVSLLGGVLNSLDRFAPFAAAPIAFNIFIIAAIYTLSPFTPTIGHAMSWGILISGFAQLGFLWHACQKAGIRLHLVRPRLTLRVKKLFSLIGPGCLGAGVIQINLFINTIIASLLPKGSISWLYYADRLHQLPLGVIGIAIGTSLLPLMSRHVASGHMEKARHFFNRGIEFGLLLSLPCAMALAIAAEPIITTLFQYGRFSIDDTQKTVLSLVFFSLGIPAFVAAKVMTVTFYAHHDTKTPVRVAILTTATNITVALLLILPLRHAGIAAATALSGWVQVFALRHLLKKQGFWEIDPQLRKRAPRILAASLAMAAVTAILTRLLHPAWQMGLFHRLGAMSLLVLSGMIIYFGCAELLGATRLADIRSSLKRSK